MDHQSLTAAETPAYRISRAQVVFVEIDGSVVVSVGAPRHAFCDVLEQGARTPLQLAPDDIVLVWLPSDEDARGVVLGRIGPGEAPVAERATGSEHLKDSVPDELLIEAKHSLTLRVGSGSITIREDGKILIKGKDLVSHAQRLNRIKGGAVQIN